ncbi:hypothetical protein BH11PSE13_BH11PSE13_27700 [soil metagenome]
MKRILFVGQTPETVDFSKQPQDTGDAAARWFKD